MCSVVLWFEITLSVSLSIGSDQHLTCFLLIIKQYVLLMPLSVRLAFMHGIVHVPTAIIFSKFPCTLIQYEHLSCQKCYQGVRYPQTLDVALGIRI